MSQFNGFNGVNAVSREMARQIENAANRLKFVHIDDDSNAMTVTTVSFREDRNNKDTNQREIVVSSRVYFANLKKSKGVRLGSGYARVNADNIVTSVVIIKDKSNEYVGAIKMAHEAKKNHERAYRFARKQANALESIVGYSELTFNEAQEFMGKMARAKVRQENPLNDYTPEQFAEMEAQQLAELEAMIAAETN